MCHADHTAVRLNEAGAGGRKGRPVYSFTCPLRCRGQLLTATLASWLPHSARDMRVSSRRRSAPCAAPNVLACTRFMEGDDELPGCPPNDTPLSQSAVSIQAATKRGRQMASWIKVEWIGEAGIKKKGRRSGGKRQLRKQLSSGGVIHGIEGAPSTVRTRRRSAWENARGSRPGR